MSGEGKRRRDVRIELWSSAALRGQENEEDPAKVGERQRDRRTDKQTRRSSGQ